MHPCEIVEHIEKRQRVAVAFHAFGEAVGQLGEAAHAHPHGEILALDIRRVDMGRTGRVAKEFHEHGVGDRDAECVLYGAQVSLATVRCKLHPICQPTRNIPHELVRVACVVSADRPGDHELGVSVQGGLCAAIASTTRNGFGGLDVLLLAVDERPNFVALHSFGTNVADRLIMECDSSLARACQQLRDSVDQHIRNAGDRPHGRTFYQHGEDQGAFGVGELVHAPFVAGSKVDNKQHFQFSVDST